MTEMSEMLVATSNAGKLRELSELLSGLPLRLRWLREFDHIAESPETGTTFTENAVQKALHYSAASGLWTMSDDSGLEVDALGGAPGIRSARYCGEAVSYDERMAKLLEELGATGDPRRGARFVCVIALAHPSTGEVHTFEGVCEGRIALEPRGSGGFGYDPLFIPEGFDRTFGELPDEIKQGISHRARALRKTRDYLRGLLGSPP